MTDATDQDNAATISNRIFGLGLGALLFANTLGLISLIFAWAFMAISNYRMNDFQEDMRTHLMEVTEIVEQLETQYSQVNGADLTTAREENHE